MNKLHNQEQSAEIRNLQKLLKSVPKEIKQEQEWQVLENMLFARMDEMEKVPARTGGKLFPFSVRSSPVFVRRIGAFGAVACMVLMIGLGSIYLANRTVPQSLAHSQIIGIKGDVTYKRHDEESTSGEGQQPPILFKDQVFETDAHATCIVSIDKGSNFVLAEKTKLTVHNADTRAVEFYLHTGSILASVSKRKPGQAFMVKTADATCKVVGTIFRVSISPAPKTGGTNLTVIKGTVDIAEQRNPRVHELVQSGQTIQVNNNTLQARHPASEEQMNIHALSLLKLSEEMSLEKKVPTGLLDISSTPEGAEVFIQGTFIGVTPLALNYPDGTYTMRLTLPGYKTWEDIIAVKKLNVAFVTAQLDAQKHAPVSRSRVRKKYQKQAQNRVIISMNQAPPTLATQKKNTKDFGFIMNAAFVEALVQMTIGEYQKALGILDSLKELPEISITEKIRIMSKIAACYKGMGNFENTVKNLTARYKKSIEPIEKSNLLWEIITVKANCLLDYEGAEKDILTYINNYPDGAWIEPAYAKLGEIQYITGKYAKAVGTFQYHIDLFKTSDVVEKSVYTLANIMRLDIKDYHMAIKWYSKLLKEYESSSYYENALFERADCYEKVNQHAKARKDYKKYLKRYPEGHLKAFCLSRLSSQE